MLMAEILSYNADIICLQEVDGIIHETLIRPTLEAKGYQGFYSNKVNKGMTFACYIHCQIYLNKNPKYVDNYQVSSQPEGCSMFWSTDSFELATADDMRTYPLRSLLSQKRDTENSGHCTMSERRSSSAYFDAKSNLKDLSSDLERWESMDGIRQLMEDHDEVRKVYQEEVGQIVQMARLSPKQHQYCAGSASIKPDKIVVANTHLFYHPMADHIRVMQAYAICHELDKMRREGQYPDPVLICGDFNSGPLSGECDFNWLYPELGMPNNVKHSKL